MENSSSIRRRTSRNARQSTPDPIRGEKIASRAVEASDKVATTNTITPTTTRPRSVEVDANEAKYVVRGILNVGPPSPAGSISSSSSGSGSGANSTGSHAYRAKILR